MPISDQALIERVVNRDDPHAFRQLVLRYQSPLRRWARRLCDGDEHLADDLAQETFIKAHKALPAFRADARFSTWLYRIAFNLAASRRRTQKHQWTLLDDLEMPEPEAPEGEDPDLVRDLQTAMARLSPAQQLAIRLSFEEEFSHGEVAQIMGLPLGTAKTHILRGKQRLETLLSSWSHTV